MKQDYLVSTLGSGTGNSGKRAAAPVFLLLLLLLPGFSYLYSSENLKNYTIDEIYLEFHGRIETAGTTNLQPLLYLEKGEKFNYRHLRASMENLHKIGTFDNIEVQVREKTGEKLDVYFILPDKFRLHSLKIKWVHKTGETIQDLPFAGFGKNTLKKALFSLREGSYYDAHKLDDLAKEAERFFYSRGYFSPAVTYEVEKNLFYSTVTVKLFIDPGPRSVIKKVRLTVNPPGLKEKIQRQLRLDGGLPYFPEHLDQQVEKVKRYLSQEKYYFPGIAVKENFPGKSRLWVTLDIKVDTGYRYVFKFKGIKDRERLISSLWKKKVFEKWAERESRARILYHLKNQGYLNARVESTIKEEKEIKLITFEVDKGRKYTLGKVYFRGNRGVPEEKLREIVVIDDSRSARQGYIRLNALLSDQEVLRWYYYSQGFPSARVSTEPQFTDGRADIYFTIDEGKKFTVDTLLFEGQSFFTPEVPASFMQTRANGPFVQQTLYKDIDKLKRLYHTYGYDDIDINAEVSPGEEKSILVRVKEGKAYRMGDLIVVGAARQQRRLIERLFPLEKNAPFDQLKVDAYKNDIENSSIFNQFKIMKIRKDPGLVDVIVHAVPDRSTFYGFGIGWEERKGLRGTLEFQQRNILNSYSSFSAMAQLGTAEKRGLFSYDTPYFFKTRINSALKLWADNEIYPGYEFYRYGIDETLLKRLTPHSYIMLSLSWYKTKLTELKFETPAGSIDRLDHPFDTTALNVSYVDENRDDPFNPTRGTFFSSDLKIGLPLLEKHYSFIKLRWSYQKNFKIFKNGTLAASVRNGLAAGEMSVTERFFAGGVKTFRGTYRDRLGPIDPATRNPRGGNAQVLFNVETTFPLRVVPVSDVYYSLFADFGNVFEEVKDIDFRHLQSAVGISLKYKTRMGPLRFDVAWNLTLGEPKFHIGIGNVF